MKPKWIIGIDEVGRGPLAGPITVAAVMADSRWLMANNKILQGIRDSKQLSAGQRNAWAQVISMNFQFAITSVKSATIDQKGIAFAARHAVAQCIKKLTIRHQLSAISCSVLLDGGLHAPQQYINQRTIIRGDETELLIAAASIIAKVRRDTYMAKLHKRLPQYGFQQHKGYGTLSHREAIQTYGLSEYHRASFCSAITPRTCRQVSGSYAEETLAEK